MKTLCIYHSNCSDGFGSATTVGLALGFNNVDFHQGVYNQLPPDVTGRDVVLVDFSYKRDVIISLAEQAKSILILDHHKTAEAELTNMPSNVSANFDMSKSGAVMAWEYYFPSQPPPPLLLSIQDRDLWEFKLEGTREVLACLSSHPYDFDVWTRLLYTNVDELRAEGESINRKILKDVTELIEASAYTSTIAGYDVPVLNAPYFMASEAGNILCKGRPFSASYSDSHAGRTFSLRSDENGIDVSAIATLFGGGGHKHSAGFTVTHSELQSLSFAY